MAVAAHLIVQVDGNVGDALSKIKSVNQELGKLVQAKTDFVLDFDVQFKQGAAQKLTRSMKTIKSTLEQNAFVDVDLRLKQGSATALRQQINGALNRVSSVNIGSNAPAAPRAAATPRAPSVPSAATSGISRDDLAFASRLSAQINKATADVSKLASAWSPAISTVKQYELAVQQMNAEQRKATAEAGRLEAQTGRAAKSAGGLRSRFASVLDTTLAFSAAGAILSTVERGLVGIKGAVVDFNAAQQQTLTGLQTQLGGSREKALGLYQDLQKLNDVSPFREQEILPNAQKFLAAKMSVLDLKDALRGISEQTSALGGDTQKFNQIATAINQIWLKPRLGLEELTTQLIEHGVPAFDLLAKAYKTNSAQIQAWITKGMIPGKEAARALWNQMERQNFGAAAKQARTFTGALSTLADITNRKLGGAFQSTFDKATQLLAKAAFIAQNRDFQNWAASVGKYFRDGFTLAVDMTRFLVKTTITLAPLAIGAMTAIGVRALWLGRTAIANAVLSGATSLGALRTAFLATGGASVVMAGVVGVALAALATDFMGIRSKIIDGWKGLTTFIARQYDGIMKFLNIEGEGTFEAAVTATMPDVDRIASDFKSSLKEKLAGADFGLGALLPAAPDMKKWLKGYDQAVTPGKMPALYVPQLGEPKAEEKGRKGRSSKLNQYGLVRPDKDDPANAIYNEQRRRAQREQREIAPMSLSKLKRIGARYIEPNVWKLPPATMVPPTARSVDPTGKMPTAAEIMRERGRFLAWRGQRDKPDAVGNLKEYGRIQDAATKAATASDLFAKAIQAKTRVLRDGAAWLRTNGANTLEYGKAQALAAFRAEQWGDANILALLKADKLNKTYTASAEVNRRVALEQQRLNTEMRSTAFGDHTQRVRELDQEYAALGDTTVQQAAARRMANREDRAYLSQAERILEITREVRNATEQTTRSLIDGAKERARGIRESLEDAGAKNPLDLLKLKFGREDDDNARRGIFMDLGQSLRVAVARGEELAQTAKAWRAEGFRSTLEQVNGLLSSADLTASRVAETIKGIGKGIADRTLAPNAAIGAQQQGDLLGAAFDRTRARALGQPTGLESYGEQLDSLTQQAAQFRSAQTQAWDEFVSRNATPIDQAEKLRAKVLELVPAFQLAALNSGQSIGSIGTVVEKLTADLDAGLASARALADGTKFETSSQRVSNYLSDIRDRTALSSIAPGIGRELQNIKQQLTREKWTPEEIDQVLPTAQIAMKAEQLRNQLSSVMEDSRGILKSTFDSMRTEGLSGIGSVFDGILDRLNQFASEFLANRVWDSLEGVFTNLLGSLGGKGGVPTTGGIAGPLSSIIGTAIKLPSSATASGGLFGGSAGRVAPRSLALAGQSEQSSAMIKSLALAGSTTNSSRVYSPTFNNNIEKVITDSPEDFMGQMQRAGAPQSVQMRDFARMVQQGSEYD